MTDYNAVFALANTLIQTREIENDAEEGLVATIALSPLHDYLTRRLTTRELNILITIIGEFGDDPNLCIWPLARFIVLCEEAEVRTTLQ